MVKAGHIYTMLEKKVPKMKIDPIYFVNACYLSYSTVFPKLFFWRPTF